MPIETAIWRIDDGIKRVEYSAIEAESRLEGILQTDLAIIDPGLMVIGRQVQTAYGKVIDLLAVNSEGNLNVIELKRGRAPREAVAQLLDYATWVQSLTNEEIKDIYAAFDKDREFEEAFVDYFGTDPPEILNENHSLVVVGTELDNSTERIIDYLSTNFGVPVNAVFFQYYKEGASEFLARTWLIDPQQVEAQASKASARRGGKEPWNGRDFYVSLGEGEHRNWDDCARYGFVSAGQGKWYSSTLHLLFPGARVFVCIPKTGYVGVGTVIEKAIPVRQFMVDANGGKKPLLEMALEAPHMDENADDQELSEYVVRIQWVRTETRDSAVWEKGMFANQNSACKLRNRYTLERLYRHFELED